MIPHYNLPTGQAQHVIRVNERADFLGGRGAGNWVASGEAKKVKK